MVGSEDLLSQVTITSDFRHDGKNHITIIKGNKIVAAGCILPLTQKELDQALGLRHRAAVGITENSDALTIIVSEERGFISVSQKGEIRRRISKETLAQILEETIIEEVKDQSK